MATKTLRVEAYQVKGENQKGKYDFIAYRGADERGKKCKYKFTRTVDNKPQKIGLYNLVVDEKNLNKDQSVIFNEYWIKKIESVELIKE